MSQKNRTGGGTPRLPPPKLKAKPRAKAKPKPPPSRVSRVRSTARGGRGR